MNILKTIKYHIVKAVVVVILLSLLVRNKICYHMDVWVEDYLILSSGVFICSAAVYFTTPEKPLWNLAIILISGPIFIFSAVYHHMYWKYWNSQHVKVAQLGE
jgi:hypothetical protein